MTKILGLDISSKSTGVCFINNGRLKKSSLDVIEPKGSSHGEKLEFFAEQIEKLIDKYKPDKIVIEDIFRGPNVNTFKVLAMFRGVCFYVLYKKLKISPICIMPTAARKLVGANGVTKEDGFAFAVKKYDLKKYSFEKNNDITDAIILGLACYEMEKQGLKESDLKKKKRRKRKKKK